MTKKIYYEKIGRKYVPVTEYDSDYLDSFPKGNTLVMCYPGGQSRKHRVEPALAPMIAAGRFAREAMCSALISAATLRPSQTPVTQSQRAAWEKLAKELGTELCTLQGSSINDIVEAGLNALEVEAEKLLSHPMVKEAYDEFLATAKLVAQQE